MLANGMEIVLAASLDQCGLSKQQIEAIAKEGYLTLTDFSLNQYLDINSFTKKLSLPLRGGRKARAYACPMLEGFSLLVEEPFEMQS